jgi:acetylornithine deacetylase
MPGQWKEAIRAWVSDHRDEVVSFTQKLCQIPSENHPPTGEEKACQEFVAQSLRGWGCEVDPYELLDVPGFLEHPYCLTDREFKDRPNVTGRLPGKGAGRSLLVSGHVDVVPLGDAPWTRPPYGAEIEDDKLYARGAYDMKGGLAAGLMAARCLADLALPLRGDFLVESVVDEEFAGGDGTLAGRLRGVRADAAIIPEPTNLVLCPAHHGGRFYRFHLGGRAGRDFAGEELYNPIYAMAHLVGFIQEYGKERDRTLQPPPIFAGEEGLPLRVTHIKAGGFGPDSVDGIPPDCWAQLFIETYPGTTDEDLERDFLGALHRRIEADPVFEGAEVRFEGIHHFLPGSEIPADHPVVDCLQEAANDAHLGSLPVRGCPFPCDAWMLNGMGQTPTVILGPGGGNAHGPDEFVKIEDVLRLTELFAHAAAMWCA